MNNYKQKDYKQKYLKYKKKYNLRKGGSHVLYDIEPIGCFGGTDSEDAVRYCFFLTVPEYTAYNNKKKTKLPFYISSGTSNNNPIGSIVPFNGEISYFIRPEQLTGYLVDGGPENDFVKKSEFKAGLTEIKKNRQLSELGMNLLYNMNNHTPEIIFKNIILTKEKPFNTLFDIPESGEPLIFFTFPTWAVKIKDLMGHDMFEDIYPTYTELQREQTEGIEIIKIIDKIKGNFNNLQTYYKEQLIPFIIEINKKIKVESVNDNIVTFLINKERVIKNFDCGTFSSRNINKDIGSNNFFGIDLSYLERIVPLIQYKKIVYKLLTSNMRLPPTQNRMLSSFVETKFTERQLLRNLLHSGINPTLTEILYNIFLCISQKNKQLWC